MKLQLLCGLRNPLASRGCRLLAFSTGWYEGKSSRDDQAPRYQRRDRVEREERRGREWSGGSQSERHLMERTSLLPTEQPSSSFSGMYKKLLEGQGRSFTIRKEAWAKLFSHINNRDHAKSAMELMLKDATIREASGWDWNAQGYGQTIFQLVQAAAAAGEYSACDWVLENAATLRVTVGRDTIPNMMRKIAAAGADVEQMRRLYDLEKSVRGSNTGAGFYELSRVYKRNDAVSSLRCLLNEAQELGVVLQDSMVEDLTAWLIKHEK